MSRRKRTASPEASAKRRIQKDEISSYAEEMPAATILSQTNSTGSLERAIIKDLELNVRSGKILKIQLKNFMCHKNLIVEFNKRANLLIGNNGSGKSAVLAALTIGLGSKANSTNRSSSVKQLIKHGEQMATIEIHLENDSFDAFERDSYGDRIIIIRTINTNGSSTYKLKNENGIVVSTSRNDLLKLALYLNIQVENPVCVLNQDLARSFLKDSDPKKQYQLFLKATQIDAIMGKLNDCTPEFENAKHRLQCEEKNLKYLNKEIEEISGKYSSLQSVELLKVELRELMNKLNWHRVTKQEKKCEEVETQLRQQILEIKQHMDKIQNKDVIEREITENITTFKTVINGKKSSISDLKEKYNKARNLVQTMTETFAEDRRQHKKLKESLARKVSDINNIETDLAQRTESSSNRILEEKKKNEEMLMNLESKMEEMKAIIDNAKRDIEALRNTITQIRESKDDLAQKKTSKLHELSRTDAQLRQFESSSRDSLSIYGHNMPALVSRIKQMFDQKKFTELPRGPLGQYIKIKQKKWCSIIETLVGSFPTCFYVNSDSDRLALNNLISKEFPDIRTSIITGKFCFQLYDVRGGMVSDVPNAHPLMKLIDISDEVVMNCFIDQVKAETILLVEDQDLAINLTRDEENIPRNLQKVILTNPLSEFYPAPMYRSYAMADKPARYLQMNMTELKKQTETRKKQLEEELQQISEEFLHEQKRVEEKQKTLRDKQKQLTRVENEIASVERKISELKNIEYPTESEEETLRRELEELKAAVSSLSGKETRIKASIEVVQDELKETEARAQELKTDLNSIETEILEFNLKIDEEQAKVHDLHASAKMRQQQVTRLNTEIKEFQSTRNTIKQELDIFVQEAEGTGERIAVDETEDQLTQSIATTEKRIRRICSSSDDIEDVKAILDMKINKKRTSLEFNNLLLKTIKELQNSRSARYAYLYKLKTHMSLRVKHRFNGVMQLRNYIGEIIMDQKNGTLELSVIPRDKHIANAVSNTKSLSGGERSYATVAFLISLWSCVDTPFYFLDEYDVFTDQVNRHTMTMLLLNEADKKPDRQFTFLTPQDMSNILASEKLTIHRMEDPERC